MIHIYWRDGPPARADGEPKGKGETDPPAATPFRGYTYPVDAPPPPFRFEHDPKARVFRLTTAEGTVEVFRDNPTRFLCVEPDPETGAMRPVRSGAGPCTYTCAARSARSAGAKRGT